MSAEDRLNDAIDDVEVAIRNFNLAANPDSHWRAGPYSPSVEGAFHSSPLWGIHFETDRPIRFGQTLIEAEEPGTFTARIFRLRQDGTAGGWIDQREIEATGQPEQCVDLDMYAPPGEYLLSRPIPLNRTAAEEEYGEQINDHHGSILRPSDEEVSLVRMSDYGGLEDDSINGVEFFGGLNPMFSSNDFWYYFYNLEVSTLDE
ncbi:MAG: hypothetical protein QXG03_11155 [Halalkalicoccus sp.]